MTTIHSFDHHLSESQRIHNAARHLGTPEELARMGEEAAAIREELSIDDLNPGVCFAKLPWGNNDRHFLWSALITKEHPDGSGLYGATKTTMAMVEYYEKPETAPHDRCTALKLVDQKLFTQAEIYDGEDPLVLFDDVFATSPAFLERKLAERYDTLMCLRAVETFQRHPFDPGDTIGLQRLVKHLEDRRTTMRETSPSGLTIGLDFGAPMLD